MRRPSCLVVAVCLLTLVLPIAAQLPIGSIGGIAKDPSGRVVPGVKVVATNEHQGSVRETTTNMDGTFTLSTVAPGTYTVVLTATGFSDVRYNHVQVPPGQAITLNTTFHVASQSTIVSVGADTSANVNLSQSMLQGQITSSTIQSLPLNGRNFLELAFLIPGNRPAPTFDPIPTRLKSAPRAASAAAATSSSMEPTTTTRWSAERYQIFQKIPSPSSRLRPLVSPRRWGAPATASSTL
jgi:hypothetical protein